MRLGRGDASGAGVTGDGSGGGVRGDGSRAAGAAEATGSFILLTLLFIVMAGFWQKTGKGCYPAVDCIPLIQIYFFTRFGLFGKEAATSSQGNEGEGK